MVQQFIEIQQQAVRTQQQQMMQLIQQQDRRLDHMANLLAQGQASHRTQAPSHADIAHTGRPRAKLPDPEKFTGEDSSLFLQFLGNLQTKLEIDAAAIGTGRDHLWYASAAWMEKRQPASFPGCPHIRTRVRSHSTIFANSCEQPLKTRP
ncbi:hypothetical protein V1522DRAFT_417730 [Lipomyces starkeyi]